MLDSSNAAGWLVFLPSIWIILIYFVYVLIHMRHKLRTIDVIIAGLMIRFIFDALVSYPIVIHYVIHGYVFMYSDCKGVIWFTQSGYWFSLGLVTALVIDVTIRMQRQTGNNLANKLAQVPIKFKFIGLAVWGLISAIIAGAWPADQGTFISYKTEIRAACTYMPFMQNPDYAIFLVVMTAISLFFCLFMSIECIIRLNQVHLLTVMKQTQAMSGGLQYQRRQTKRLIRSLRVTLVVTLAEWLGSHFPAIVLNLHGLVQPDWHWEPLVLAHYWLYLFEMMILPILLIATTTRYRHPLYVLFHWAMGLNRADRVCELETNDRRLKNEGEPVADVTIVNRSSMAPVPSITVYEEVDFNDKQLIHKPIKDMRQKNMEQPVSVELHPTYQPETVNSILKRSLSGAREQPFKEEKLPNKRTPPQHWLESPEILPKSPNILLKSQAKQINEAFEPENRNPVMEEVCLEQKVVKNQSLPNDYNSQFNQDFLIEDNLRSDEELKEASIMFDDDFSHSRGNSDLEEWEKEYSRRFGDLDNGYNSFRNLEMLSDARAIDGGSNMGESRGKSRGSLNNSFWLSENDE